MLMDSIIISKLERVLTIITIIIEIFWSEGYCYFLDFLRIAYDPVTNRFTRGNSGPRFPTISRTRISDICINEAYELTGFSINQLQYLFTQLCILDTVSESRRYMFKYFMAKKKY